MSDVEVFGRISLPPRSRLFRLEPYGVGTADCESLRSLVLRLSDQHNVPPHALVRDFVRPEGVRLDPNWTPPGKMEQRLSPLRGIKSGDKVWIAALESLTSLEGLAKLTLSEWGKAFPVSSLGIGEQGWCARCYQDDLEAGRQPYERLLWSFDVVSACPAHGCRLEFRCPKCGVGRALHGPARMNCAPRLLGGYCPHCGFELGAVVQTTDATAAELRTASLVGELLACPEVLRDFQSENVRRTLWAVIHRQFGSVYCRFAKALGVPKNTTHSWLVDGRMPGLDKALAVCAMAGCSLVDYVSGVDADALEPSSGAVSPGLVKRRARKARCNGPEVLASAREVDVTSVNTVTELAARLGCHPRFLTENCPELTDAIKNQRAERNRERLETRRSETRNLLRPIFDEISVRVARPATFRQLMDELTQRGLEVHFCHVFEAHKELRLQS